MKVTIYEQPNNPIKTVTDIASISYGNEYAKNPEKLFKHLAKLGHLTPFESVTYIFKVEGISRACLGQLTRHRHLGFNVRSQRYTSESETGGYTPDTIRESEEEKVEESYKEFLKLSNDYYDWLVKRNIPKEDARMVLPMAIKTDLYVWGSIRSLIEMYPKRNSKAAQEEIRVLVNKMVDCIECELVKQVIRGG